MDDLISRQAAIDAFAIGKELLKSALDQMYVVGNAREKYEFGIGLIESYIADMKELPSALPERKKGKWLPYEFGSKRWHKCSVCGIADEYINEKGLEARREFCPHCGAQMKKRSGENG